MPRFFHLPIGLPRSLRPFRLALFLALGFQPLKSEEPDSVRALIDRYRADSQLLQRLTEFSG